MIKIILFLLLVVGVVIGWTTLQNYDIPITANVDDYLLETSLARLGLVVLVLFVLLYIVLKFLFWLKNSPKRILAKIKKENEESGYKNIMIGFSALAAGDVSKAKKMAQKAEKALPQENLVKLLLAQAASVGGDKEQANEYYKALTATEEGKFIGFRGLISQAIESNQPEKALQIADELLKDNPKSLWLNEALIDLGFRNQDWDRLEKYLRKAEANKAIPSDKLKDKFAVFYYMKAKIAAKESRKEDAVWLGERALKYNDEFLPAILFLAEQHNKNEDYKKAKTLIEDYWQVNPSRELGELYRQMLFLSGERNKLKFFKRLYDINSEDVESIALYVAELINNGKTDEAKEILLEALKTKETKSLCLLMAQIDDKIAWQNRAENAIADKTWHCRVTGARYPFWQLYSDSGELNTIVYGYLPESAKVAFGSTKYLIT